MRVSRRWYFPGSVVLACMLLLAVDAPAQISSPRLDVQVAGHGEPQIIFIPGLATPGSVWDQVVARFETANRCHVVTLAGFGGKPPVATEHFLDDAADAIIAYAREQKLDKPVLVGHSLGGLLAMKIALKAPDLPGRLVIVDSLPFLAGMMGPGIETAADAQALADGFRTTLSTQTPEQFAAGQRQFVGGMVTSPEKAAAVAAETGKSDPATTGQAMGELIATDLRADLGGIHCPALVLGALADKVEMGLPRDLIEKGYRRQYEKLAGARFEFFEHARHFIMTDDLDGFTDALRKELAAR